MLQRAKTSIFIFNKLMNIVLGSIPALQLELLLFYGKNFLDSASLVFYRDDIFGGFETYYEYYLFLRDHFFLYMVSYWLKLILSKVKIGMTKILVLTKEYKIRKKIRLKTDKIEKSFIWRISQEQRVMKSFLGTI